MVSYMTSSGQDVHGEIAAQEHAEGIHVRPHDADYAKDDSDINKDKTVDDLDNDPDKPQLTEEQLEQLASRRALRTSTWINTFFLLTTDIMGPSVAPWAMSYVGYIPGFLLFFFLGTAATYTGFILMNLFLKLDTEEAPIRTFSDIGERVYGSNFRVCVAFLQAIQLQLSVSVLILGEAQVLQEMLPSGSSPCFLILTSGWTLFGMCVGFIKAFSHLAQLANWCIWMNISICIVCMALGGNPYTAYVDPISNLPWSNPLNSVGESLPNFPFGPVTPVIAVTSGAQIGNAAGGGNAVSGTPFNTAAVANSTMNIVYAYGGATMFVELLSEMKNPREFWKSLLCCEAIIIGVYMTFGLVYYAQQGQYVSIYPQFGIFNTAARQYCNGIGLFTAIIAACMYGNTGMKVFYFTVIEDVFHGPKLGTRKGSLFWFFIVITFWWMAFVIASAVPSINSLVGVVGALCIMSFSYTLPPIMQLGFYLQQDRTWRERLTKLWWLKTLDLTIFLGALAATGIGLWGSVTGMIATVQSGATNSLSCSG